MQSWAMLQLVKDVAEKDDIVEMIPYKPATFVNKDEIIVNRNFFKKEKHWDKFIFDEFGISEWNSDIMRVPKYDIYIVGSDCVWDPTLPVVEKTSEYYLDFVDDGARRVSYAASIGQNIDKNFSTDLFEENIPKFDYLSVREMSYVSFIERFTSKKCYGVLDPTFVLNKKYYEKLIAKPTDLPPDFGQYMVCVMYSLNNRGRAYDLTNRYSIVNDLNVVHDQKYFKPYWFLNSDYSVRYSQIGEILWLIKNSELVITDSYHYMLFSIIFHKPFYIMMPNRPSRLKEVLVELGLTNRIIGTGFKMNEINREIDYQKVEKILSKRIEESRNYLKEAIS